MYMCVDVPNSFTALWWFVGSKATNKNFVPLFLLTTYLEHTPTTLQDLLAIQRQTNNHEIASLLLVRILFYTYIHI